MVPGHLHEQLHKADIFIQGFNVLHFFFSERKVKDLKQQKEKTGYCDDGSSLEPGSEDSEGAPQVGLSVGEPAPLKLCMWGTAEPRMGDSCSDHCLGGSSAWDHSDLLNSVRLKHLLFHVWKILIFSHKILDAIYSRLLPSHILKKYFLVFKSAYSFSNNNNFLRHGLALQLKLVRDLLGLSGWSLPHNPPASASWVWGSWVSSIISASLIILNSSFQFLLQSFPFSIYHTYLSSVCMHMCRYTCVKAHMWRSEDNLQELVFSFHHVASGDWT